MHSRNKIIAVACILAVLIGSVYSANHQVPQAFYSEMKEHRNFKRSPIHVDRFAFAEESEKNDNGAVALSCCPCGSHHCCGSMCHG